VFVFGYKFFVKHPLEDTKNPNVEIVTHGNQSPGIVVGNYEVKMHERPRNKN
jgi:hypothetical protein